MTNQAWVEFLQWVLPQMQLRRQGFRRVRRQVCKQIQQRLQVLDLSDLYAYRYYTGHHPQEWVILDSCCRITISRFYRDRWVFERTFGWFMGCRRFHPSVKTCNQLLKKDKTLL